MTIDDGKCKVCRGGGHVHPDADTTLKCEACGGTGREKPAKAPKPKRTAKKAK